LKNGYSEINAGYPFYFYCGCFYSMEYPLIWTWMSKEEFHRSKGYIEVTVRKKGYIEVRVREEKIKGW